MSRNEIFMGFFQVVFCITKQIYLKKNPKQSTLFHLFIQIKGYLNSKIHDRLPHDGQMNLSRVNLVT